MDRNALAVAVTAGFAAALLPGGLSRAQEAGDAVVKTGTFSEDLYLAGGRVEVAAEVKGDVMAAGGNVTVDGRVSGDVMAAGGEVEIAATVEDDVRAAGGSVKVRGRVGDDAALAGGRVEIGRDARIGGRAFLVGGEVRVAGQVAKALKAGGGTVVLEGEVLGDAEITAERVEVGRAAHVAGTLRYASAVPAVIAPGARIDGPLVRLDLPARPGGRGARALVGIIFLAGIALVGVVALLLAPRSAGSAARLLGGEPWKCLGSGLVALVVPPPVFGLVFLSGIGIPLALVAAALWVVLLLLGYLLGALFLGDLALRRLGVVPSLGKTVLAFLLALVALRLLRFVPFLGALVQAAVLVAGTGTIAVAAIRAWRASRAGGVAGAAP